jgi:uncharacterized repeat protein (TIGR03806 family)
MRASAVVFALALLCSGAALALPSAQAILAETPPAQLSAYGFFRDGAAREPAPSVTPYLLNAALFSDGAEKLRYVYVPPGAKARYDAEAAFDFPVGSALIKTFATPDGSGALRFIETRLLLRQAAGWRALPYVWRADGSDADLALAGAKRNVAHPQAESGELGWRVPNVNQCKGCHALAGAIAPLGPKARHLNRRGPDGAAQLVAWAKAGLLDSAPAEAPKAPAPDDTAANVDARARAYLDINCAHCHNPNGPASNSGLDLSWGVADPHALGVGKRPVAAGRGSAGLAFSIAPGRPDASILLTRMESPDPGVMMPELGRTTIDAEGVALIRRWIAGMKPADGDSTSPSP